MQNERGSLYKLTATGQQNDVFQKLQGTRSAPVLVVDLAIDVIRIRQIDQLGARLEVTVTPARQAHARRGPGLRLLQLLQVQQHELSRVQAKALVEQRRVHRAAERHQLRLDARQMGELTHGQEHFFQQPAPDLRLRKF